MSTTIQDEKEYEPKRDLKELIDAYKADGISGITKYVERSLKKWKDIPLDIAVTGSSGAGKSSYINAIRGLTADDEGAAEVGVTQTTSKPTPYLHPENDSLKLWDLPGVGTRDFPQDKYRQKVDFDKFDFFLIFTCSRFTELDHWLAKQVQRLEKKFYFIRTKVDLDVYNDRLAHPRTHKEADVKKRIKDEITKLLQEEGFQDPKIFLINSFEPRKLDFGSLTESLIRDFPVLKKESFVYSINNVTEELIKEKEKYLRRRIYLVAIGSAVAAAIPIPGLGIAMDIGIMLEEANFYRKQLRLDDNSMKNFARALHMTETDLMSSLDLESRLITFTAKGLMMFFSTLAFTNITEDALSLVLPVVGSVVAAGLSYGSQVLCLRSLLEKLVKDALKINRRMVAAVAEKTV